MKKSTKVVLIISSIILVILLTLIGIISYFEKLQPEEIVYPGSGLSGSIFDTQNTEYTPNASFPEVYGYKNVPYLLDVPASNKASVGEGTTYRLNNGLYIYTSEFPYNTDIDYTLSTQLGKTLMLDCNDDMTIVETMKEEIGYRNGFGIVYDCKNMYISNGTDTIKAVLLTYYVELPDEDEDVLIGVISQVETNEAIRQMKDVLDAELATFRYDEDHLEDIQKRIKDEQSEQAREEREKENQQRLEEREQEQKTKEEEEELKKLTTTSDVDIELENDYATLELILKWQGQNAVQSVVMISPDGNTTYEPADIQERQATFTIPRAVKGTWIARVTGVNVGSVNIVMNDLGDQNEEEYYEEEDTTTSSSGTSSNGSTSSTVTTEESATEITTSSQGN